MTIKILNLYAGIGGNRKLWGGDIKVVAVENNPQIAQIYKDFFPDDEVIIADAHHYLLEHFKEFDFIWSSPPCPSHSRVNQFLKGCNVFRFPDMKLYEEIIFLQHYFKGKWVVENVISYYDPLIKPTKTNSHYYWSNFIIPKEKDETRNIITGDDREFDDDKKKNEHLTNIFGFDFTKYDLTQTFKEKILNNCVQPKMGLRIFESAFKEKQGILLIGGENK